MHKARPRVVILTVQLNILNKILPGLHPEKYFLNMCSPVVQSTLSGEIRALFPYQKKMENKIYQG